MTEQRKNQLVGLLDDYVALCRFSHALQSLNEGATTLSIFEPVRDFKTFGHHYDPESKTEFGVYDYGIQIYAGIFQLAEAAECTLKEDPASDDPHPDPDFPLDDRVYFVYRGVAFFQLVGRDTLKVSKGGFGNE